MCVSGAPQVKPMIVIKQAEDRQTDEPTANAGQHSNATESGSDYEGPRPGQNLACAGVTSERCHVRSPVPARHSNGGNETHRTSEHTRQEERLYHRAV